MKINNILTRACVLFFIAALQWFGPLGTLFANPRHPVAILSFSERGPGMEGQGANVRDLLFVGLMENPNLVLVERQDLDKILKEAELNLSGAIASNQATQIGQLTGAKILITGSVFRINNKTYLIAKIIGTETGKVLGKSVNGTEEIDALAMKLARLVEKSLTQSSSQLVAPPMTRDSFIQNIRNQLKGKKLPPVTIQISEQHIGAGTPDPAAETELTYIYKALNGKVFDPHTKNSPNAKYHITGQGISEFAARNKNLISVKARLEVKVTDKQGNIIAIDRQTIVKVDLNEILAGKAALQEAAQKIAGRIIKKIAFGGQ